GRPQRQLHHVLEREGSSGEERGMEGGAGNPDGAQSPPRPPAARAVSTRHQTGKAKTNTQEKKIHETLVEPRAQQRSIDTRQSLCCLRCDRGIVESHGSILLFAQPPKITLRKRRKANAK